MSGPEIYLVPRDSYVGVGNIMSGPEILGKIFSLCPFRASVVTFCWACKLAVKSTAIMACVCPSSVSQWYQFLREKCSEALLNDNDYTFDGPGVVVQIDESVVARRK